jgi:3',5'-cyclic AMP phosphodiesterase CpdA
MKKQIILLAVICLTGLNSFAQFTFIHITDLHVSDATSYVNSCDNKALMFQCYIKEFARLNPKPAFVMATGDITNIGNSGPYGMYPMLTQNLFPGLILNPGIGEYFIDSAQTIPIYFTPGNHDYYTTLIPPTNNTTLVYYPKYIAPDTDYVVTKNNAIIICMRSGYDSDHSFLIDYNIENPEGSGFSVSQCAWLRSVLKANSSKKKIIVFHHPAVVAGTNSDGSAFTGTILDTADGSLLNNRTTFLNICDSNHVDIVLNGHVHQNVVANRKGQVVDENCDTCGTRYVQTGAAFNGSYRIITVNSSFVNVSVPLVSCAGAGINELNDPVAVYISPNPATDNITVDAKNSRSTILDLRIYDVVGNLVLEKSITGNKTNIDVSSFSKGMYFLKVKAENGTIVKKFVKE